MESCRDYNLLGCNMMLGQCHSIGKCKLVYGRELQFCHICWPEVNIS